MAFRIAIVGFGDRGRQWARFVRESGVATLAGIVETDEQARAVAAGDPALAGTPIVHTLADLPRGLPVNAAIVATGATHHAAASAEAIARGLSVLVEKPFTLDLGTAVELVKAAEARGVALLVAQNYRYMRAHRTVRRIVQDGVLGQLSTVSCHYWRTSHVASPELATLETAALWETGVHHLDVLRYVLNRRVVAVSAEFGTAPWSRDLQGTDVRVLLDFEGGVSGVYTVSWAAPGHEFFELGQQFYERLTGERGTLHVLQRWLVLCLSGRWPRVVRRGARREPEEMTLLRQLASAHARQDQAECSGRDNLQTMAVLAACMESSRTHRSVDPQELLRAAGA